MKISSFLKHVFIPHKGNSYKPHLFREHVVLSIFIITILLLILSFTTYTIIRTTTFGASIATAVLTDLTNQVRKEHDLPPLVRNSLLDNAAEMKKEDMLSRHYFAHDTPEGVSPWHWITKSGYHFSYAGENLAFNFSNSQAIIDAWLNSPKHRDNILNRHYRDIGVSVVRLATSSSPLFFTVQMFGAPAEMPYKDAPASISQVGPWYATILFDASYYIGELYLVLIIVLIISLLLMIFIEIRVQHLTHIVYGIGLIIIVAICISINSILLR